MSNQPGGLDPRAIKLAIYGFLIVLLVSMIGLKPYLPKAIFYNFANIDDYQIFPNRLVKAGGVPQPWKEPVKGGNSKPNQGPSTEAKIILGDLKTTALLMIENQRVVYEAYSEGGSRDQISGSFSMAKTIVGLLAGFAVQDGAIDSLDQEISKYITEWEGLPSGKMTIRDLLHMSTGLNWDEGYSNPFSITAEAYYGSNLRFTALRQRNVVQSGQFFEYQSGATQILGMVVARAVNRSLSQYASEKLWTPLGATQDALWSLDREGGIEKAFCCFNATARDFARLGQLVLAQGKWITADGNSKQLLNADFLKTMTTPHGLPTIEGEPTDYYGEHIWIYQSSKGPVPYFRGILGQYILIFPQTGRVVVRLGKTRGKKIGHHPKEVHALVEWGLRP